MSKLTWKVRSCREGGGNLKAGVISGWTRTHPTGGGSRQGDHAMNEQY